MYRRLIFGLLEGSPKSHLERLGTGYGRPGDYSTTEGICVGPMQLWNDSQAADWVIGQLKSLGIEINETTTKN
jgi:hypothetical protein